MEEDFTELLKKLKCDIVFKNEDDFGKYCEKKYHSYPNAFLDLKNCIFLFNVSFRDLKKLKLTNCHFKGGVNLIGQVEQVFELTGCHFHEKFIAKGFNFKVKARFRECHFCCSPNFRNTKFMDLADFWRCEFHKPVIFYKTDFNDTVVFSSATFDKNVLFTYTLFGGRGIFGRTKFRAGFDFSQAIIKGDLKFFDTKSNLEKFSSEYVGEDDEKFRKCIEEKFIIPQINKVSTFQQLKYYYSKEGNFIDEIEMQKNEKSAFSELIDHRTKDANWSQSTFGDSVILFLNRWTNHYKSDFRNGVSFIFLFSILFVLFILLFSRAFWDNICWGCEVDWLAFNKGVKLYINFLNPVHKITYIDDLRPLWGIPYILDFLGRIVIGFGIYQTIQAFRKYK